MKKFYMVVQDGKTLWFTGESEKQLDCFLQYMDDSIRLDDDLASFELWVADRMVMEPGASHIQKTPLDVVLNRKGMRYAECPVTDAEREYIANDVLVVKEAME